MNKTQKMQQAARKNRKKTFWATVKKILLFPWRVCKAIWRFLVRVWRAFWNWLTNINVVGMINLTLLVAIIVLVSCLISNVVRCDKSGGRIVRKNNSTVVVTNDSYKSGKQNVQYKNDTALPVRANAETGITPKIKTVGVDKPVVVQQTSLPEKELPKQNLSGDVIVDMYPGAPVLMNGVNVDGNLYVQNMRKYTLPCGTVITGHLIIRNVQRLSFCGPFVVNGNIYVNRQSSFGPLPSKARIGGQVIL